VFKEMNSLYQIYSVGPNFGVEFSLEAEAPSIEQLLQPKVTEDMELIEDTEDTHAIAAFYADNTLDDETRYDSIQFDAKLGLAVEAMADGVTLEQLWRVI
jgi:hypothetical protein